jgi:hypothetical protein
MQREASKDAFVFAPAIASRKRYCTSVAREEPDPILCSVAAVNKYTKNKLDISRKKLLRIMLLVKSEFGIAIIAPHGKSKEVLNVTKTDFTISGESMSAWRATIHRFVLVCALSDCLYTPRRARGMRAGQPRIASGARDAEPKLSHLAVARIILHFCSEVCRRI